jgi:AcrR family transcriptional regulator
MKKSASRDKGRSGRRGGDSTSRDDILRAARRLFAEQGYSATSVRRVADEAGVDPALVHYFFKSKDGLYGAAMEIPFSPADIAGPVLAEGVDGAGEKLVRRFLEIWENPDAAAPLKGMIRSAIADSGSATTANFREFVENELRPRIAAATGKPDGDMRAILVGTSLVGLVVERYLLEVEPIASADHDTIVRWLAPTIQRYLTGD